MHLKGFISTPIILFFAFIWIISSKDSVKFCYSPLYLPLIGFFSWSIMSLLWSSSIPDSVFVLIQWMTSGLCFLIVLNIIQKETDINFLLKALFFAGVAVALIGCIQYIFEWKLLISSAFPSSTFGNRNGASRFIVLIFPIGLALLHKKTSHSWPYLIVLTLMIVFLSYTKTVAAWLAILLEILLFYALLFLKNKNHVKNKHFNFTKILTVAIILFICTNLGPDGFKWRGGELIDESSSISNNENIRLAMWANTFEMIKDHPLTGVGVGNWAVRFHQYNNKAATHHSFGLKQGTFPNHAHNDFLEILSNLGFIGIVFIAWFLVSLVKLQWPLLMRQQSQDNAIPIALFCSIAGILFCSLFGYPFFNSYPLTILMIYSAAVSRLSITTPTGFVINNPIKKYITISLMILFSLSSLYGYKAVKGENSYSYGRALIKDVLSNRKVNKHSSLNILETKLALCHKESRLNPIFYNPYYTKFLFNCAIAFNLKGYFNNSQEIIEYALEFRPYDLTLHTLLYEINFKTNNFEKAIDIAKRMVHLFPYSPQGLGALSKVYHRVGKFKASKEYLQKARAIHDRVINRTLTN